MGFIPFFQNEALIPYYLKPVHFVTLTLKNCRWKKHQF
ncbi:hypothetical protein COCON_G00098290 [Conger conger]|uniref:Uncharacterized protein n=1 Tax=Conger conger TaxID=82655 RepID=A0A9Q1DMQ6_CONCO|nr:hypothetical protein COCON_G00098290 [Conger conger]